MQIAYVQWFSSWPLCLLSSASYLTLLYFNDQFLVNFFLIFLSLTVHVKLPHGLRDKEIYLYREQVYKDIRNLDVFQSVRQSHMKQHLLTRE